MQCRQLVGHDNYWSVRVGAKKGREIKFSVKHRKNEWVCFVGAFAGLRKATVSLISVRMEQLGSHWTDLHEMRYLKTFGKSFEEIEVSLKSDVFMFMIIYR